MHVAQALKSQASKHLFLLLTYGLRYYSLGIFRLVSYGVLLLNFAKSAVLKFVDVMPLWSAQVKDAIYFACSLVSCSSVLVALGGGGTWR